MLCHVSCAMQDVIIYNYTLTHTQVSWLYQMVSVFADFLRFLYATVLRVHTERCEKQNKKNNKEWVAVLWVKMPRGKWSNFKLPVGIQLLISLNSWVTEKHLPKCKKTSNIEVDRLQLQNLISCYIFHNFPSCRSLGKYESMIASNSCSSQTGVEPNVTILTHSFYMIALVH